MKYLFEFVALMFFFWCVRSLVLGHVPDSDSGALPAFACLMAAAIALLRWLGDVIERERDGQQATTKEGQ